MQSLFGDLLDQTFQAQRRFAELAKAVKRYGDAVPRRNAAAEIAPRKGALKAGLRLAHGDLDTLVVFARLHQVLCCRAGRPEHSGQQRRGDQNRRGRAHRVRGLSAAVPGG